MTFQAPLITTSLAANNSPNNLLARGIVFGAREDKAVIDDGEVQYSILVISHSTLIVARCTDWVAAGEGEHDKMSLLLEDLVAY